VAIRRATVLRVAAHVAAWMPFLAGVAGSMRGSWRVVGDGAVIALRSWNVLTGHGPLVGQATSLARGVFDPGPLQYWLLAVPVHLDPVRGVLWGAALWCMAAGSLTIEATWSVLGEIGGLLASGTILGMVAWMPGLAIKPYWNPWFGAMFFLAALAAGWTVMSGRRRWWPVLVITASVAAQAHLMFAVASAALVLLALIVGLADRFRAKAGYQWAIAGLMAGLACWTAPVIQQFTSRAGNFTALLRHQGTGPRTGLTFALKTVTAFTQPPPLWWMPPHPRQQLGVARLIDGRSAVFAVAILAVTAGAMLVAVFWLRSRPLAALAAISLLASAAALVTFSRIPLKGDSLVRVGYLIIVMFPVGLLIWVTAGPAFVLTARQVINRVPALAAARAELRGRQQAAVPAWTRWAVRVALAAAVPLIVLASLPGLVQRTPAFPGDPRLETAVSVSAWRIEQALPSQRIALSVAGSGRHFRHRLTTGLVWALTAAGYHPELSARAARWRPVPRVTVLVRSSRIAVDVTKMATSHPAASTATLHPVAAGSRRPAAAPMMTADASRMHPLSRRWRRLQPPARERSAGRRSRRVATQRVVPPGTVGCWCLAGLAIGWPAGPARNQTGGLGHRHRFVGATD